MATSGEYICTSVGQHVSDSWGTCIDDFDEEEEDDDNDDVINLY